MNAVDTDAFEGTALSVYAYVVKEGRPVGPSDVMRGIGLSSPSVAYWHLQRLETSGLLKKNEYGKYIAKEKVTISGYMWIGRKLLSKLMCYSFFFMGLIGIEMTIILFDFLNGHNPELYLIYLVLTNIIAMVLFLSEGWALNRKYKNRTYSSSNEKSSGD